MSSYKEVGYKFDMVVVRLKLSSKLIGILRCQRYNISKKKPAFYILSKISKKKPSDFSLCEKESLLPLRWPLLASEGHSSLPERRSGHLNPLNKFRRRNNLPLGRGFHFLRATTLFCTAKAIFTSVLIISNCNALLRRDDHPSFKKGRQISSSFWGRRGFVGHPWPSKGWPSKPPFCSCKKRMLIQIGLCPMNEGVTNISCDNAD